MTDEVLNIGDSFYIPIYVFRYPAPYETVVDIKWEVLKVSDIITSISSKGTKITYVGSDGYKYNSKRIFTKPSTTIEESIKILKRYVKYRNTDSVFKYTVGEYVK